MLILKLWLIIMILSFRWLLRLLFHLYLIGMISLLNYSQTLTMIHKMLFNRSLSYLTYSNLLEMYSGIFTIQSNLIKPIYLDKIYNFLMSSNHILSYNISIFYLLFSIFSYSLIFYFNISQFIFTLKEIAIVM
jgi:hypothetical protein